MTKISLWIKLLTVSERVMLLRGLRNLYQENHFLWHQWSFKELSKGTALAMLRQMQLGQGMVYLRS